MVGKYSVNLYLREMSRSSKEASGMKSHRNSDLTENADQKNQKPIRDLYAIVQQFKVPVVIHTHCKL